MRVRTSGIDVEVTGAVSGAVFGPDGGSLAVGWASRGAAVFGGAGTLCGAWGLPEPSARSGPATIMTSAWRGDARNKMPKRSMS